MFMTIFSKLHLRSHVRLFLIFICTFLIPLMVLTGVFLQSYRNIYSKEVQQSVRHEMDSIATTMNAQSQITATYAASISQDLNLKKHLKAANNSEYSLPANIPSLHSIVQQYVTGKPSLLYTQVIILTPDGEAIYGRSNLGALQDPYAFQSIMDTSYRSLLKSTFWLYEQQFYTIESDDSYIYVVRPVTDSSDWQLIGYVVLRFRSSDFISMYLPAANSHRSIFVLDSGGNPITFIDNLGAESFVFGEAKQQLLLTSEVTQTGHRIIYSIPLSNLWYLISVTETGTAIQNQMATSITLYIVALLLCIALTISVSYIISKRFMRPINQLIGYMQEVEHGNLHSRAVINTHDEFETLANSYNKMIQRVEDLMRQIIFEQEQKRESDIQMLQAQINPHFLYNTLASIRYMIYTNPPQDIDKILIALSRFLKYVLSNAEDVYVTLDREFEQMENYITIQQFGFDVPLQYKLDIEPHLGHCLVVKMLFQPLIENAILHGLKLNKTDPILHIQVTSVANDKIQIKISDNGAGFDASTLSHHSSETNSAKPSHHLGVSNVHKRLWLHYGESFLFNIQSQKGVGTTIVIQIPKLTEEDMSIENSDR